MINVYIDFKAFRTRRHLEYSIMELCEGRKGAAGTVSGICPRLACQFKTYRTMKCVKDKPIAFCHACHTTFDALQIVADSLGVGLRLAALWLDERVGN